MNAFVRYPHTPHLTWLSSKPPRADKVLSADEVASLLAGAIVVEEKIDGANIGLSVNHAGEIRVQNRGDYLRREHAHPQFGPLWAWLKTREKALVEFLSPHRTLFGEWCYAVHTVPYDRLPDWFLGFDVFDHANAEFWDSARRDTLLSELELHHVPQLATGTFTTTQLKELIGTSKVGRYPMEGIVVRQESLGHTTLRAKVVRKEFAQATDRHWSQKPIRRNRLIEEASAWR